MKSFTKILTKYNLFIKPFDGSKYKNMIHSTKFGVILIFKQVGGGPTVCNHELAPKEERVDGWLVRCVGKDFKSFINYSVLYSYKYSESTTTITLLEFYNHCWVRWVDGWVACFYWLTERSSQLTTQGIHSQTFYGRPPRIPVEHPVLYTYCLHQSNQMLGPNPKLTPSFLTTRDLSDL